MKNKTQMNINSSDTADSTCVNCLPREQKRWRATAVQNAGALADDHRMREASWSAPALWRFGRATELNAKTQRRKVAKEAKSVGLESL
jgi:hypothetical protein